MIPFNHESPKGKYVSEMRIYRGAPTIFVNGRPIHGGFAGTRGGSFTCRPVMPFVKGNCSKATNDDDDDDDPYALLKSTTRYAGCVWCGGVLRCSGTHGRHGVLLRLHSVGRRVRV